MQAPAVVGLVIAVEPSQLHIGLPAAGDVDLEVPGAGVIGDERESNQLPVVKVWVKAVHEATFCRAQRYPRCEPVKIDNDTIIILERAFVNKFK